MCWFCLGCLMTATERKTKHYTFNYLSERPVPALWSPFLRDLQLLSAICWTGAIKDIHKFFLCDSSCLFFYHQPWGRKCITGGGTLRIYSFTPLPVHTLGFLHAFGDASSQLPVHVTLPATSNHTSPAMTDSCPSGNRRSQCKLSLP